MTKRAQLLALLRPLLGTCLAWPVMVWAQAVPELPPPPSTASQAAPSEVPVAASPGGTAGPVGTVGPSLADQRPFATASWTLGQLSGLAHHVYTDPYTQAARLPALRVLEKLQAQAQAELEASPAEDGLHARGRRTVLQFAIDKARAEVQEHETRAREKAAFLARHGLEEVRPSPIEDGLELARENGALAGLRAEVYRQRMSDEHVIVFRGSSQREDWLNNLWLGVDHESIEAPYYQAAEVLLQEFFRKRPGVRPLVTGHSLGGGLAQYMGHRFGLHAVAFNSSPLPPRYLEKPLDGQAERTRVYTAVYEHPVTRAVTADPLSITLARWARSSLLSALGARATQHLVPPTCTLARPEPFFSPEEERAEQELVSAVLSTPSILSKLGWARRAVGESAHLAWAAQLQDSPAWKEVKDRHGLQGVLVGRRWLKHGANKTFAVQAGLLSVGKLGSQALRGKLLELGGSVALKTGLFALAATAKNWSMAHSMDRYHRGLTQVSHAESASHIDTLANQELRAECTKGPPHALH